MGPFKKLGESASILSVALYRKKKIYLKNNAGPAGGISLYFSGMVDSDP